MVERPAGPRVTRAGEIATLLTLTAALVVSACASSPPSPLSDGETTTRVTMQTREGAAATDHVLRREDFVAVSEVRATRQEIWPHLLEVWSTVGLPDPVSDPRAFSLTLTDHTLTRRLGGTNLSSYLSCGSSMTGWNADTHRIRLTVRTVLERVDDGLTRVHTRIDAVASNTSGTSTAPIQCASRGTLEELISKQVRDRLAPVRIS